MQNVKVSPYSYLTHARVDFIYAEYGAELVLRQFLLDGVLNVVGTQLDRLLLALGRYMNRDIQDWAEHSWVPLHFPEPFCSARLRPCRRRSGARLRKAQYFTGKRFSPISLLDGGGSPAGTDQVAEDKRLAELA